MKHLLQAAFGFSFLVMTFGCTKEPDCSVKYTRLVTDGPAVKQWSQYLYGQRLINNTVWLWSDDQASSIRLDDRTVVKVPAPAGINLDLRNTYDREHHFVATGGNALWVLNPEEALWEKRFTLPDGHTFGSHAYNVSLGKIPFLLERTADNRRLVWWHDVSDEQSYEATGLNEWLAARDLSPTSQPMYFTNGDNREALAVCCYGEGAASVLVLYDFSQPDEADTLHLTASNALSMFKVENRLYVQSGGFYTSSLYRIDTDHPNVLWKALDGRFAAIGPYLFGENLFGGVNRYDEQTGLNERDHINWYGGLQLGGGLFHGEFAFIGWSGEAAEPVHNRIQLVKTNYDCTVMDAEIPGGITLNNIIPFENDSLIIGFGNDGRVHFFKPQ